MTSKMPTLVSLLFSAITQGHIFHLQTKSYAKHKALDSYYNELGDLLDGLVESYQGRYDIIKEYPKVLVNTTDPIKMVEQVRSWIDDNRSKCATESELQNIIDEIVDLHNTTLYKLKNLS